MSESSRNFEKYAALLDKIVDQASKDDLAECVRDLAMDLAKYKLLHGESAEDELEMQAIDESSPELLEQGMMEAVAALARATGQLDEDEEEDEGAQSPSIH